LILSTPYKNFAQAPNDLRSAITDGSHLASSITEERFRMRENVDSNGFPDRWTDKNLNRDKLG
jgi:hypothetical protein